MRAIAKALVKALGLGLLLAACTAAPPLLSPLEQAKRYGYSERELAPDRFEVSYQGSFFAGGISEPQQNGSPCRAAQTDDPLEAINVRITDKQAEDAAESEPAG